MNRRAPGAEAFRGGTVGRKQIGSAARITSYNVCYTKLLRYLFHGFAVLRLLQALGAFGNLGLNKNKPHFLALIPSRLEALSALLRAAEIMRSLPALRDLLLDIADDPSTLS